MMLTCGERPRLAPGVQLAGQMRESAFQDPPWLVEQVGTGYLFVSELLYRVAELCDGEHTLAQIADGVSAVTNRRIGAEDVRRIIAARLLPAGLVTTADGPPPPSATRDLLRSPLALNMRMKLVRPAAIDPLVRVLAWLYAPPVLVGVLLLGILGEAWTYLVHGVSASVHDALYAPGLLLLLIAIAIVSAAFHELGHAAALHYGGGRIKGMGAGLYTIYPAFYTDVSDNYRLPRWARVRTDLGGFYFNLIFGLVVLGIYLLSGQEFLLLIVVMINVEILHQLMPFVRLDGYWTLADLTGVPDFFSQMSAFVRGMLPLAGRRKHRAPALKWWAKVVFASYTLITVPLLVVLGFVFVRAMPRIAATAWDSLRHQIQIFEGARTLGDGVSMLAALVQMVLLALPALGAGLALVTVGRRVLSALWAWSRPTPARRVAGALASVALTGGLGLLWLPQLPWQPVAADAGQPSAATATRLVPIGRDERGTLGDALGDLAASLPRPAGDPAHGGRVAGDTPGGTPAPAATTTTRTRLAPRSAAAGDSARAPMLPTVAAEGTPVAAVPSRAPSVGAPAASPSPSSSAAPGASPAPSISTAPSASPSPLTTAPGARPSASAIAPLASPSPSAVTPAVPSPSRSTAAPGGGPARPTTAPVASPAPPTSTAPAASPTPATSTAPAASPTPATSSAPAASPTPPTSTAPAASPTPVTSTAPAASPTPVTSTASVASPTPPTSAPPAASPTPATSTAPGATPLPLAPPAGTPVAPPPVTPPAVVARSPGPAPSASPSAATP